MPQGELPSECKKEKRVDKELKEIIPLSIHYEIMKKVLLIALAACQTMLFNLNAQSNTVVTVPPLAGGNGSSGVTFNLNASTTPVIIDTVLCAFYGPGQVELWYSPTPINGAPTVSQANGWVLLGSANIINVGFGTTNPILQPIPIPVNLTMNPGQTFGFAISGPSTVYTSYSGGISYFSDGTVGIETGTNVGYGGNVPNPSFHPRQFNGGVIYHIAQNLVNDDAGVNALFNPKTFYCSGNQTVQAQVRNNGLNALNSVNVNWKINGQNQNPVALTGLNLATAGSTLVNLGNFNFLAGQTYLIEVWTSQPNGQADLNTSNDTLVSMLREGLSGTFTLNPTLPSGGVNFTSFNEAADTLEVRGICSAVSVEVVSGLYTEQVVFGEVPGASQINTITYKSQANDSTAVELTFTSTNSFANFTVRFNGADHHILEALKITKGGSNLGRVIDIRNRATRNTIKRCYLLGDTLLGTTSNLMATVVSDINTGGDSYNTFSGNRIEGGSYGIFYKGATGNGSSELGSRFIGNILTRQFYMGMEIDYQDSLLVEGNQIKGNSSYSGTSMGIQTNFSGPGMRLAANIIEAKGSWPTYGIYLTQGAGSNTFPSRVYNNAVMVGDSGVTNAVYAIVVDDMINLDIDHNTCIVRDGGQFSGGLFISSGSNIRSRNNNLACRVIGIPYISNNSLFVGLSNYNNLYTPGPFIGGMGNLGYTTLGAWKNATGLDINSLAVNPLFTAWDDYHTCRLSLDGNGTPFGYTHDVDGEIRNMMNPDIGADEFFHSTTFSLGPDLYKCANDSVILGLNSMGPGTYFWSTFEDSPTITVTQAGTYELFLVGSCNSGVDTIEVLDYPMPTASFTHTNSFMTYLFASGSTGTGLNYSWDFGDGNSSSMQNPNHLYNQPGTYTVSLTVTDTCGNTNSTSKTINASQTGLDALQAGFTLHPNPTPSNLFLGIPTLISQPTIAISDLSGRTLQVHTVQQNGQAVPISLSGLSAGTYMLSIHHEQKTWTTRVVKQ
jgi:PKD repeat protein